MQQFLDTALPNQCNKGFAVAVGSCCTTQQSVKQPAPLRTCSAHSRSWTGIRRRRASRCTSCRARPASPSVPSSTARRNKCHDSAQCPSWLDRFCIHRLEERPEICSHLACQALVRQLISGGLARPPCEVHAAAERAEGSKSMQQPRTDNDGITVLVGDCAAAPAF
jgi:hypothetical protein